MTTQTFPQWLTQQNHRDDPIGDLARDVEHDPTPWATPGTFRHHLTHTGADPAAHKALTLAENEWATRDG